MEPRLPVPRAVAAIIALVASLVALPAPPAHARPNVDATVERDTVRRWETDRLRIEPLEASRPIVVGDLGTFRGAVEVVASDAGLSIVNELPLEHYLLGISEVPVSWPIEAQRAQAIAARTYAVHEMQRPARPAVLTDARADLCATDACQVYVGLAKERRPGAERWAEAVRSTAGQVLLHRGRAILAKYSSTNGGRSVDGGRPYLRAVDDPDDAVSPYHRWTVELPLAEVAGQLGITEQVLWCARRDDLVDLHWDDPTTSAPMTTTVPAADLRARANASRPTPAGLPRTIPSVRFEVTCDAEADILRVEGRGWGHGIGMSQYGALGKARRGMRAADILAAYYGGLRPARAPLPVVVRVAVAFAVPEVSIGAEGAYRVTDGAGRVVAPRLSSVLAVARTARGISATAANASPVVTALDAHPEALPVGVPVRVRYRVSAPGVVRVRLHDEDGRRVADETRAVTAGEVAHVLQPVRRRGDYLLTVEARADGGRPAPPVGLTLEVAAPTRSAVSRSERPATFAPPALGLAVALGVGAIGRRRLQLHRRRERS